MHPSDDSVTPQHHPVSGGSSDDNKSSHPQTLRATWHDYRQRGVYMLTLCTEGRRPLFGRLVPDESGKGTVCLTPLGEALEQALQGLSVEYEEVEFIRWVVMPDHLHVVVQVHEVMNRHLGEVVRRLKYLSTVAYLRELDQMEGGMHRIEGSRLSKREREAMKRAADGETAGGKRGMDSADEERGRNSADGPQKTGPDEGEGEGDRRGKGSADGVQETGADKREDADGVQGTGADKREDADGMKGEVIFVQRLWQENYHDRVLTEYGQLTKMLNYVSDNPRRAWIKRQHPRLFYDKWTLDLPIPVELARALYRESRALGEVHALEECLLVDRGGEEVRTSLRFRAMGNCFLANETVLVPLRMSRRATSAEIKACCDLLDERCITEGAVVITPCVSQGEQTIVDSLLAAGHRVIRLQHEAMSTFYAPSDRYLPFVACGQMLLLAPWPEQPLSNRPNKGRFELMNAICRVLSGEVP